LTQIHYGSSVAHALQCDQWIDRHAEFVKEKRHGRERAKEEDDKQQAQAYDAREEGTQSAQASG